MKRYAIKTNIGGQPVYETDDTIRYKHTPTIRLAKLYYDQNKPTNLPEGQELVGVVGEIKEAD